MTNEPQRKLNYAMSCWKMICYYPDSICYWNSTNLPPEWDTTADNCSHVVTFLLLPNICDNLFWWRM